MVFLFLFFLKSFSTFFFRLSIILVLLFIIKNPRFVVGFVLSRKEKRKMQSIYILDSKGKILISRSYRGSVSNNVVSRFVAHLLEDEEVNLKPVNNERRFFFSIGAIFVFFFRFCMFIGFEISIII